MFWQTDKLLPIADFSCGENEQKDVVAEAEPFYWQLLPQHIVIVIIVVDKVSEYEYNFVIQLTYQNKWHMTASMTQHNTTQHALRCSFACTNYCFLNVGLKKTKKKQSKPIIVHVLIGQPSWIILLLKLWRFASNVLAAQCGLWKRMLMFFVAPWLLSRVAHEFFENYSRQLSPAANHFSPFICHVVTQTSSSQHLGHRNSKIVYKYCQAIRAFLIPR